MRKKLFTIIMSVMMVAVFMPTMAFADSSVVTHDVTQGGHHVFKLENIQFNGDFTKATADVVCEVSGCPYKAKSVSADVEKLFNEAKGYVEVTAAFDVVAIEKELNQINSNYYFDKTLAEYKKDLVTGEESYVVEGYYYDFTGATFVAYNPSAASSLQESDVLLNADAYADLVSAYEDQLWLPGADAEDLLAKFTQDAAHLLKAESNYDVVLKFVEPEAVRTARLAGTYPTPEEAKAKVAYVDEEELSDFASMTLAPQTLPTSFKAETMEYPVVVNPFKIVDDEADEVEGKTVYPTDGYLGMLNYSGLKATVTLFHNWANDYVDNFFTVNGAKVKNSYVYTGKALEFAPVYSDVEVQYTTDTLPQMADRGYDKLEWTSVPPTIKDVKAQDHGYYTFAVKALIKNAAGEEYAAIYKEFQVKINPAKVDLTFKHPSFTFGDQYVAQTSDVVSVEGFAEADQAVAKEVLDKFLVVEGLNTGINASTLSLKFDRKAFDKYVTENKDTALAQFDLNYILNNNDTAAVNIVASQDNPVKQTIAKINAKKGKNKTVQLKVNRAARGALTWKKLSGNKKVTVSKDGKLVVKKGLKKGTYKVKVSVTAAGNEVFLAKTVTRTLKVVVK